MRNVKFEENELLVMAMFDAGNRRESMERIEEIIPHVEEDQEIYSLVLQTIEKLKRITDMDYHRIDLEGYKQELEDGE